MLFCKSVEMPRGGGPENVVIYGVLSPSSQIWLVHGQEVKTDWELKVPHCTCPISSGSKQIGHHPILGICTWLSMPRYVNFEILPYFQIPKASPRKSHILKSSFWVKCPSLQLQFAQKNELLTLWIDKVMKFWSMAPSTNPLKPKNVLLLVPSCGPPPHPTIY